MAAVDAVLDAGCDLWEKEGYIMVQLKAIVVLEPDASAMQQPDGIRRARQRLGERQHVARIR